MKSLLHLHMDRNATLAHAHLQVFHFLVLYEQVSMKLLIVTED